MNLLCLCPTYGRPKLVANAVACFEAQDYPAVNRAMVVLDDAGQMSPERPADNVYVISEQTRFPSLPAKYNHILDWYSSVIAYDAVIVWDDDDVYCPWHLSRYAEALANHRWAHPTEVWSDYTGRLGWERAQGRFHGSLGIRRDLLDEIGGWIDTPRADFDQQQIQACARLGGEPGRPDCDDLPSYVFRWSSTGAGHCQGLMSSPANEDWYSRVPISHPGYHGPLVPKFDQDTAAKLATLTAARAQIVGA